MTTEPIEATVFGLGEAGSLIARDLARAGVVVHGFDPADVPTPRWVLRHDRPDTAVADSTLVLTVTAAADATMALAQAREAMARGTVYADLSTSTPLLMQELASVADEEGISFTDVALMAPVPGNGLATPSLASGPGAARYAEIVTALGGEVEVIGERAGDAAAQKLMRSVVTKGLTALIIESLAAAEAHGSLDRVWRHLVDLVTEADGTLLQRFVTGTPAHVERRIVEMDAARDFLLSLGVSATMTTATAATLREIEVHGLPDGAAGIGE